MEIKINKKILMWLLIGILTGLLVSFSISYAQLIALRTQAELEGNTTIIRIYRGYIPSEEAPVLGYLLDVQHRIYPDSIVVPSSSSVDLFLDFTCNFEGAGDWNVQPSDTLELIVDVSRMPSNCSIESYLAFESSYQNREFYATITFNNPNNEAWNVGRPLVKVFGVCLGQPSEMGINTPDVEVVIETNIS